MDEIYDANPDHDSTAFLIVKNFYSKQERN